MTFKPSHRSGAAKNIRAEHSIDSANMSASNETVDVKLSPEKRMSHLVMANKKHLRGSLA